MDSISYRVHFDISKGGVNSDLANVLLYNSNANRKKLRNSVDMTSENVEILANQLLVKPVDYVIKQMNFIKDNNTTNYITGRFHTPSSHYDVSYILKLEKNCVDINFSIPKYLYGHSISQFVYNPHTTSPHFNGFDKSFLEDTSDWYNQFVIITKDFFRSVFLDININYEFVEVVRIDLAFNQYFKSKGEALRVASLMAKKSNSEVRGKLGRKEYSTEEQGGTGFSSIQRNMYYKVYHKGTEFKTVGDKKRLERHNRITNHKRSAYLKELGINPQKLTKKDKEIMNERSEYFDFDKAFKLYDIDELQKEADLILRHEIRFVPKSMSRLFKKEIFRKNDKDYNDKIYHYKKLNAKNKRYILKNHPIDKLTREEQKDYSSTKRILDKRHRFFLKVNDNVKQWTKHNLYNEFAGEYNEELDENKYTNVHFDKVIFDKMKLKFFKVIKESQVNEFTQWQTIESKILNYNMTLNEINKGFEPEPLISSVYVEKIIKELLISSNFENVKKLRNYENQLSDIKKLNENIKKRNKGRINQNEISIALMKKAYDLIEKYNSLDVAFEEGEIKKSSYFQARKNFKILNLSTAFGLEGEKIKIDYSFNTYFKRLKGFGVHKPMYDVYFSNMLPKYSTNF